MVNQHARYFEKADIPSIQKWLNCRNLPIISEEYFSPSGFIVPDVACGFIFFTNSAIGVLDFFISNPHADIEMRRAAFMEIMEALLLLAKTSGCKALKGETIHKSMEDLVLHFQFKETGLFKSFFKEL